MPPRAARSLQQRRDPRGEGRVVPRQASEGCLPERERLGWGAGHGAGSPSEPPGGTNPASTLIVDSWPRGRRGYIPGVS